MKQRLGRMGEWIPVLKIRISRSTQEKLGLGWRPKPGGASNSERSGSSIIHTQAHSVLGCGSCPLSYLTYGTVLWTLCICGFNILLRIDGWWGGFKSGACPIFNVVCSFLNTRLNTEYTLNKCWLVGWWIPHRRLNFRHGWGREIWTILTLDLPGTTTSGLQESSWSGRHQFSVLLSPRSHLPSSPQHSALHVPTGRGYLFSTSFILLHFQAFPQAVSSIRAPFHPTYCSFSLGAPAEPQSPAEPSMMSCPVDQEFPEQFHLMPHTYQAHGQCCFCLGTFLQMVPVLFLLHRHGKRFSFLEFQIKVLFYMVFFSSGLQVKAVQNQKKKKNGKKEYREQRSSNYILIIFPELCSLKLQKHSRQ